MLNIGKLRRGGENYYLNSVARGVEDYYLGSGEVPGYWLAMGARDLGLDGEVGDGQLRNVLRGIHPNSARTLAKLPSKERVPGFDLTFLAPKSVALLHELGSKEASNETVSAHDAAVAAALDYLERHASDARRGKGGRRSIASNGFIAAAFRHRTSRAGDPLLHTHVLVANLIKAEDGRWGALDAKHLYRHAKTAGYLYQAHLRAELTRRLGVEWTEVRKGAADIEGIPRNVIQAFSKRRREVEAVLSERDATGRQREVAALTTRQAKDYSVSPQKLLPEWRDKAASLGFTAKDLDGVLQRSKEPLRSASASELATKLVDPSGLTAQASSFSRREVLQALCAELQDGAPVHEVEALADEFLRSTEVVALSARAAGDTAQQSESVLVGRIATPSAEPTYSTAEMLSTERAVIERALERRLEHVGVATPEAGRRALSQRPSLFDDQQAMVLRLTTSGSGVEVVVGKAGAGKTFALDAAREAWESSGHRVIGCSLSARAAEELQSGSGIESFTLARLIQDLDSPERGGLRPNSVVVVDEAGMVGTRTLGRLLRHAAASGSKVVLVGDDRQLPEIEAGGAFRGIKNRMRPIELSEVRRQPFGWERDALDLLREGRADEAIREYKERERVFVASSGDQTRARLVADWWRTLDEPEPGVMIAARHSDVADLNARARHLLVAAGRLGDEELEVAGDRFASGDRVMTLKNTRSLGIVNGSRGFVETVDAGAGTLTIRLDSGDMVTLPRGYLESGYVTHAYAITGHKAQGMTTQNAFVLGDETLYREWGYVAMSRGKETNSLYVVSGTDLDREQSGGEVAVASDPTAELIKGLSRSRAKDLALDVYEDDQIRSLNMSQLRGEWESLSSLVDHGPPDVSGQRERILAEEERLQSALARAGKQARQVTEELAAMGWRERRRDPAKTSRLERRKSESERLQDDLVGRLRDLGQQRVALDLRWQEHEQWRVENAPALRRHAALERELWWREHHTAMTSDVAMPNYLKRDRVAARVEVSSERRSDRACALEPEGIERSLEL